VQRKRGAEGAYPLASRPRSKVAACQRLQFTVKLVTPGPKNLTGVVFAPRQLQGDGTHLCVYNMSKNQPRPKKPPVRR